MESLFLFLIGFI